ncbi:MAG: autotransporter domain-containing protein [Xanthobacteraceae bacterium]|nr:autotransporter domain-containing protein [Xanthobacteraceae bacterium]
MATTALPVWAEGGDGGSDGVNAGGAGGTGFVGNAGGTSLTPAGGGGGGAGGGAGGGSAGGGAGGAGGANGNGAGAASITNAAPLAGGDGSSGGDGPPAGSGGGGGGGAGGYGAIVTGGGASSNSSTITGGDGGAGGASGGSLNNRGGNGGDGGVGIEFTTSGATFTNSAGATVTGGNGGAGGAAFGFGTAGIAGSGGAGIVGSGLTIINSGTISGGLSGTGLTRADAITFTGGANVLELQPGSFIAGNVVVQAGTGTLRLAGTGSGAFDASSIGPAAQYRGFGSFEKTGTSTWSLTGTTTALTPWTISGGTLSITADGSLGASGGVLTMDGGTLQFLNTTTSTRNVTLTANGGTFNTLGSPVTLGGTISGVGGSLTKTGLGILTLSGTSTYDGATTVEQGTLQAGANNVFSNVSAFEVKSGAVLDLNGFNQTLTSLAGAGNVTLGAGTLTTGDATNTTLSGAISGTGGLNKEGTGIFTLSGANNYSGTTNINAGTLQAGAASTFSSDSAIVVGAAGTLDLNGFNQSIGSLAGSGAVTLGAGTLTTGNDNTNTAFSGTMTGTGGLTKVGTGIFTLDTAVAYTGATNVDAGTLRAGAANVLAPGSAFTIASGATLDLNSFSQSIASLAGAGDVTLGIATLTAGSGNTSTTFSGNIFGTTGGLTKVGTGTLTLSGTGGYTGATNISGGTLLVTGDYAGSPFVVNSGGTLGGSGFVGATTVAGGGTLAPGSSTGLNVNGTLTFNSGSTYAVGVSPTAADKVVVAGTASLAGTVQATFQGGTLTPKTYTILTSAGLGGTTFDTLTAVGAPAGFALALSYTATDALLSLTAALGQDVPLNRNQQNVASAINSFFNGGGTLPPEFLAIYSLTGKGLQTALSQLSGEGATGAPRGAAMMTGQFLGLMLDPFVDGRTGGASSGGRIGFAQEDTLPDAALAYGTAPPRSPRLESFDRRWGSWAAGFGGSGGISGDAATGSNDLNMTTYGVAVGLDYRFSSDTVAGFSFAGGGTNWGLPQGLGGGSSDAFLFGAYAATRLGPAYLATSFAFANHWVSTDRTGVNGNRLKADYTGQNIGGRIEGGYRYGNVSGGITPYAAAQVQVFQAPSYTEIDTDGGPFALHYNAKNSTDWRTEFGARFDAAQAVNPTTVLTWRSRLAWGHSWTSTPSLNAGFVALPGAIFTVTGAAPAKDVLLASAGFDLSLTSGVTLLGKFDGEFGSGTQIFSGTAALRYRW